MPRRGLSKPPAEPVVKSLIQKLLHSHNSFNRDEINGYFNLFIFVISLLYDNLEKVEELVNLAFQK
jgi:hypothetical protein